MKILIMMAFMALGVFGFNEARAQRVIKDADGKVFIDVRDMLAGTFSTTTLNTVKLNADLSDKVYKRFQVSSVNQGKWSFANSLGIKTSPTNFNTNIAVGQVQGSGDLKQGCSGHAENGFVAGSWRVPTQKELVLMYMLRDMLVRAGLADFLNEDYRSSTEATSSDAVAVDFLNGTSRDVSKETSMHYRCVREVN